MFCQGVKEEETVGKKVKLYSNIHVTDTFFYYYVVIVSVNITKQTDVYSKNL